MSAACRACGRSLTHTLVDLGEMPLANAYVDPASDRPEARYPLHARVCDRCFLVQVDDVTAPTEIFSDYAYFSSVSSSWVAHAAAYAAAATDRLRLGTDSLVVEIASNDGYLLRNFVSRGIPVLGVEPAANVARAAIADEIPTIVEFFGEQVAEQIVTDAHRHPDLVVANNVVAHVPDLLDFLRGVAVLLRAGGVATFEFPHLLSLLEETQFDTIYHEHYSYFSVASFEFALHACGLSVFDIERLPTHGGSLRVHVSVEARPPSEAVASVKSDEAAHGLDRLETYLEFGPKVEALRTGFRCFLEDAVAAQRSVVAYGAAAKGNTFLNYCGVGVDEVAYVVDRSPQKQGLLLPGTRLPIEAPERVFETRPDLLLILPWNLRAEIKSQMSRITEWGGRFVVAVPEIEVFA